MYTYIFSILFCRSICDRDQFDRPKFCCPKENGMIPDNINVRMDSPPHFADKTTEGSRFEATSNSPSENGVPGLL